MPTMHKCPNCGAPTTFKWECDACADIYGGDQPDD